jgi:RNA 2',3'-cyclic 3'-phosphodiesterase
MIRAFLAIRPTEPVITSLLAAQTELDEAGADVRWVSAEAVHLTIQFLGDVRESEVPQIQSGLVEQLGALPPFEIECRGLGTFPNQKRPRVVWVGLRGDGIQRVADAAETVLSPLGFPPEERDLTPHITIGRVRSARGAEALVRALKENGDRVFGSCRIEEVILYRSQLRSDGAVYTPLVAIPLRGA